MNNLRQLCLLLYIFFTSTAAAQTTDVTGLWKGTIYNDTTRLFYPYEIGISNENGALSGFSHTWFVEGDKQYFGLKKVKIKRDGIHFVVEDNGLIAHNYPEAPAKGVRQRNLLELRMVDSIMILEGTYTTNATRDYRPLTGKIHLERKNDFWQSALVPHLAELRMQESLSFVKEEEMHALKQQPIQPIAVPMQSSVKAIPASLTVKGIAALPVGIETEKVHEMQKDNALPDSLSKSNGINKIAGKNPVQLLPAADVDLRKTIVQQTVVFTSDSLQLSLYDNGEVDGDTVSVVMNGEVILGRRGLSTNAVKKTVYIPAGTDTVTLVMYAETLGSIPPNTGLLVVRDGRDLYEIRFSGDLQKNAAIVFRRRK